jgi:hypothetical protein
MWSDSLQRRGALKNLKRLAELAENVFCSLFVQVLSRSVGQKQTPAGRFGTEFAFPSIASRTVSVLRVGHVDVPMPHTAS